MQINRSNYEIWFIDWLDGNLNEIQAEQLIQFLRQNPDLKDELEEINTMRLKPSEKTYPYKNHLKKTSVSDSQFEYLCVAYNEHDLSPEQDIELKEIVEHDPEKRKVFDLIRKTKLSPTAVLYKRKKLLIKRTIGQNVIRIAIVGLSAAAITILSIIAFKTKSNFLPDKSEITAQIIKNENKVVTSSNSSKITTDDVKHADIQSRKHLASSKKTPESTEKTLQLQKDSSSGLLPRAPVIVEKITRSTQITLNGNVIPGSLIALQYDSIIPQDYDNGQSRFSKFIAKAFREKLLREKTPKDSPLKAYEIAEAGITGLNKLLGWEMALDERKDENGKLKSVYFSSKILKFNAPVKKSE